MTVSALRPPARLAVGRGPAATAADRQGSAERRGHHRVALGPRGSTAGAARSVGATCSPTTTRSSRHLLLRARLLGLRRTSTTGGSSTRSSCGYGPSSRTRSSRASSARSVRRGRSRRPRPSTHCATLTDGDGPSLSGWVAEHATIEQVREFCIHRSQYQLKEADPHTWVIPRLRGRAKAAFVAIQFDEYGAGRASDMHAELFAETMRTLGLDDRVGAYLDLLPAATLATGNLVTMFGLHRRWRAAAVGHLALFEMTSVGPMQRYSDALARLGVAASARRFYDVHVTADVVHERMALDEMVADLVEQEPAHRRRCRVRGPRALALVEQRFSSDLLRCLARRPERPPGPRRPPVTSRRRPALAGRRGGELSRADPTTRRCAGLPRDAAALAGRLRRVDGDAQPARAVARRQAGRSDLSARRQTVR